MERSGEPTATQMNISSYSRLLQEAPDAMLVVDHATANICEFNRAAEELLGTKREEACGKSIFVFAPSGSWFAQRWAAKKLDETGYYSQSDVPHIRADGTLLYADVSARRVMLEDGKVTVICLRDVTDRLADVEDTKRRNGELQFLYDMGKAVGRSSDIQVLMEYTLDAVLAQLDVEIGCIYLLDEKRELLLLTASRGLGKNFILEMGRIPRGKGLTWAVIESGEPLIVDNPSSDPRTFSQALRNDNIRYYAAAPLFFGVRALGAIVASTRGNKKFDRTITDFLYAIGCQVGTAIGKAVREEAIRQSEVLYRKIFDTSRDPVILVDVRALDVIAVNKAAERVSGYREEELREQPFTQLFGFQDPNDLTGFAGILQRLHANEKVSVPAVLIRKSGQNAQTEISLSKIELGGKTYAACRLLRFSSIPKELSPD